MALLLPHESDSQKELNVGGNLTLARAGLA